MRHLTKILLLAGSAGLCQAALADNNVIQVNVNVANQCTISTSTPSVTFPAYYPPQTSVDDTTASLSVQCSTIDASPTILLSSANNDLLQENIAGITDSLPYNIYEPTGAQDKLACTSPYSSLTPWPTSGYGIGSIANTDAITVPVCLEIPVPKTAPVAGNHTDTLTVTLAP